MGCDDEGEGQARRINRGSSFLCSFLVRAFAFVCALLRTWLVMFVLHSLVEKAEVETEASRALATYAVNLGIGLGIARAVAAVAPSAEAVARGKVSRVAREARLNLFQQGTPLPRMTAALNSTRSARGDKETRSRPQACTCTKMLELVSWAVNKPGVWCLRSRAVCHNC